MVDALPALILAAVVPSLGQSAFAAPARTPSQSSAGATKPREIGQHGSVKTENAMVFEQPNLESEPIRYLPKGKAVILSRKTYGDAELPFYKVKLDRGRVGYVATIDVEAEGRPASEEPSKSDEKVTPEKKPSSRAEKEKKKDPEEDDSSKRKSIYETRWAGITVGQLQFSDSVGGNDYSEGLTFYGLRLDGPGLPFGAPSEINVIFHYGPPSYYDRYSLGAPTGYAIHADFLLMLPLFGGESSMLYLLAGPALTYSVWGVSPQGSSEQLAQLSIGASLGAGAAVRVAKIALRLDYKFIIEDRTHKGFLFSAQLPF